MQPVVLDHLVDGDDARVLETPGHTPACVTYVIGDCAFVGDTLFMPDFGSARCDFPGGDARELFRSIQRLLPSVQINMRAGRLPPPEDNGRRYLKLPLGAF